MVNEDRNIEIDLIGNTGLRNPIRIHDGFQAFSQSKYIGHLHGTDNEINFMKYLSQKGVIHNKPGKDLSGSHARKWRLMFERYGFIYGDMKQKHADICQEDLGPRDTITPFGNKFLQAKTLPDVEEMFLRALSVEQYPIHNGIGYYSPFRWILAILIELKNRNEEAYLSRIEFALWGQTTNPSYDINFVVASILDLRARRKKASSKRTFDKNEIASRSQYYKKKSQNFLDYADMNMRYLRISGLLQRKGRGIMIVPSKYIIAEKMAKCTPYKGSLYDVLHTLTQGAPLPTDNLKIARSVLENLQKELQQRHILYDISDCALSDVIEINRARRRLEDILAKTNEIQYAEQQRKYWHEIADYMSLLIKGGGRKAYDDDYIIEVPKDETPVYLEWTLWRAALAIDHLVNKPYEVRGFRLDSDFLPVSTAGGGKGDLYWEFQDFTILTEVTMSTSSRQEAMEGEPVRRHVAMAMEQYHKPVYGLFIAIKVDLNTTETFRHGIWYDKKNQKQHLQILPLSLTQFRQYFISIFCHESSNPSLVKTLLDDCIAVKDKLEAPEWTNFIDNYIHSHT